jgi:hypothetical protein
VDPLIAAIWLLGNRLPFFLRFHNGPVELFVS